MAHRAKFFHQLTGKLALVHEGEIIPIGVREPILDRSRARQREGGAPELLQRSAHHYLGTGRYCCVVKLLSSEYSADPHKNKIPFCSPKLSSAARQCEQACGQISIGLYFDPCPT